MNSIRTITMLKMAADEASHRIVKKYGEWPLYDLFLRPSYLDKDIKWDEFIVTPTRGDYLDTRSPTPKWHFGHDN